MKKFNDLQRELGLIGVLGKPRHIEQKAIEQIDDFAGAIRLCLEMSRIRRSQTEVAYSLGMKKAQFSEILNGKKHLPGECIKPMEWLCGNRAISQYIELRDVQLAESLESPADKIARLEEELHRLKRNAA